MYAHKTSDESRNTTTTLTADSELEFAVEANKTYDVVVQLLLASASATPDFKFDFVGPSGYTPYFGPQVYQSAGRWSGVSVATAPSALLTTGDVVEQGSTGAAAIFGLQITATIKTGANAGNVQLRWAQNTSNGSDVTVKAGSFIRYAQASA